MNKLFLIAVAIACSGAVAQEKEIWACQQEDGVILKRENSAWKQYGVTPGTLLLTVDGLLSERKEGDTITPLTCDKGFFVACRSPLQNSHILLDPDTGKMGMSELYGAVSRSADEIRGSVSVEIFNCTKF